MASYREKLLDPRWQRMRLTILDRDNWCCTACKCRDKTLHVHHCVYLKGRDPWDHPETSLLTLCEECHKATHSDLFNEAAERLVDSLRHAGWTATEVDALNSEIQDDVNGTHKLGHSHSDRLFRWIEIGRDAENTKSSKASTEA